MEGLYSRSMIWVRDEKRVVKVKSKGMIRLTEKQNRFLETLEFHLQDS